MTVSSDDPRTDEEDGYDRAEYLTMCERGAEQALRREMEQRWIEQEQVEEDWFREAVSGPRTDEAAKVGLVPQEWCPGGNRCMKPTGGKTGRCHNRARWCDTEAAARYDRYGTTWTREPGSYAYKVCNGHARKMIAEAVSDHG